jgi:hypothetical protein
MQADATLSHTPPESMSWLSFGPSPLDSSVLCRDRSDITHLSRELFVKCPIQYAVTPITFFQSIELQLLNNAQCTIGTTLKTALEHLWLFKYNQKENPTLDIRGITPFSNLLLCASGGNC